MQTTFTATITKILTNKFGDATKDIYDKSFLLQYINIKTRSANRGAKSRGSFGNLYALYVLIEDYLKNGFDKEGDYSKYGGARFTDLLKRQRELPFGRKLQNHHLNHRMNEEFKKYFQRVEYIPILRDADTNHYWINENLIIIEIGKKKYNIADSIIKIIDKYIEVKRSAFESFIETCEKLKNIGGKSQDEVQTFIIGLLAPNVDARIFEIVSYAILKYFYHDQIVYFGFDLKKLEKERLTLYKTGRTNANDGGIDFVMKPLGRFFQVTETLDVKKYFLDIDKIERFPISFVIKAELPVKVLSAALREGAKRQYGIEAIVEKYMKCIEEIINIPALQERFKSAAKDGYLNSMLDEIIKQSKVEFNYEEEVEEDEEEEEEESLL